MTPIYSITSVLLALVLPQATQGSGAASVTNRPGPQGTPAPVASDAQPSTPAPDPVIAHARALPDSTVLCLSLTASRTQLDALAELPVMAALRRTLAERGLTTAALDMVLREATGIATNQWLTLTQHGVTFALTGIADDGKPRWLAIADAQDQAEAFALFLDRLRQTQGVATLPAGAGGTRTWTLSTGQGRVAIAIDDNRIVAGDSSATVDDALARLREAAPPHSLASTPGFPDFELTASAEPHRLLCLWLRPSLLAERLIASTKDAPPDGQRLQGILRALDLTRIAGIGLTLATEDGGFVESFHLDWPGPRNGPFAELLAPKAALRSEVAALVPADVESFSTSAIDLQRLYHAALRLVAEFAPGVARAVEAQIAKLGDAVGVDFQDELLGKIGNQVVSLQWGPAAARSSACLIQLNDAPTFDRALRRALSGVGTVHEQSVNGYRTLVVALGEVELFLAVTEDNLVVASSATSLQRTLDQVAAPRGATPAVQIPAGLSAYGVAKLQPLLEQIEATLGRAEARIGAEAIDRLAAPLALLRAAVDADDTFVSSTARDERTVTVRLQSPCGGVVTMALIAGCTVAAPATLSWRAGPVATTQPQRELPDVLRRIVAAERDYRAAHAGAASSGLQDLAAAGLLDACRLDPTAQPEVFTRDGYKLTLLRGAPERPNEFVVVAWPADNRTGPVLAATEEHPVLVNDVMAQAAGMARVELADVYTRGFGSAMRSGWHVPEASSPADPAPVAAATPPGRLASAIEVLGKGRGDVASAKSLLHAALDGSDAAAAAYAAHAAGRLKLVEEVPSLITLVKHADATVRTQALWALLQFGDPRSRQTAVAALTSDDVEQRRLAAGLVGRLRASEATPALLGVLASQSQDLADQSDRAAALLALADIGDPAPLLQAAAAVTSGDAKTVQALTYAFQTLSVRLAPKDEATTLVAVLDHQQAMLRRYAIQRLGELREPATVRALEGRLAHESRELLPLVQVSLQAVRKPSGESADGRTFAENAKLLLARIQTTWTGLEPNHRYAVLGAGVAMVAALLLVGALRRRQRLRAQGDAWAAMAASSQSSQFRTQDEVDLAVGESGVYSPHESEEDRLLQPTSEQLAAPYR